MFHQDLILLRSTHLTARYKTNKLRQFRYKKLTTWQRQASGLAKWDAASSARPAPLARRFFGDDVTLSKGTNPEAYKWWNEHRYFMPSLPPADYEEPVPIGRQAWPAAWSDAFAEDVLRYTDAQIKDFILETVTPIIFEETQREGFELRKLDFEGRPLTDLPDRRIIEEYILEEPALRDRIIQKVLEEPFAITPNSAQRKEIRDVPNLVRFAQAFINRCRVPESAKEPVAEAVQDFLAELPRHMQPLFGWEHALPQDQRSDLLVKWEAQFKHPWQFGGALYEPRSRENTRGNMTWMKSQRDYDRLNEFEQYVSSGQAQKDHLAKIEEAGRNNNNNQEMDN
jgi:hypothetical protein